MFKAGDKIVYYNYNNSPLNKNLKYLDTYIVLHKFTNWVYFKDNTKEALMGPFFVGDFILVTDLRKPKIEKICSKLHTLI